MFKKLPMGLAALTFTAVGESYGYKLTKVNSKVSIPACNSASFPDCLKAETEGVWKL